MNQSPKNIDVTNEAGVPSSFFNTVGLEVSWLGVCLAGLAALGLGCTHIAGKKNDMPIICNVLEPIRYSKEDSVATIKQIDVHNKVWDCYCVTQQCVKGGKYFNDK